MKYKYKNKDFDFKNIENIEDIGMVTEVTFNESINEKVGEATFLMLDHTISEDLDFAEQLMIYCNSNNIDTKQKKKGEYIEFKSEEIPHMDPETNERLNTLEQLVINQAEEIEKLKNK